ncbi:MAG: LytR C-terminal domain-containing protein [bacterium]
MNISKKYLILSSILLIAIIALCLAMQSCSFFEYLDGSSEKEIKKFQTPKKELQSNIKKLIKRNKDLQDQLEELKGDNAKSVQEKEELRQKLAKLEREKQKAVSLNAQLEQKKAPSPQYSKPQEPLQKKARPKTARISRSIKSLLTIKVLSGDGDIESAHAMADRLRKMGYNIKLIDYAPRSNFTHNTVYYASNSRKEADELIANLGGNAISKPISWHSKYDLIFVTGYNP